MSFTWASSHQTVELLRFRSLDQVRQLNADSFLERVILNTHIRTHKHMHIYCETGRSCPSWNVKRLRPILSFSLFPFSFRSKSHTDYSSVDAAMASAKTETCSRATSTMEYNNIFQIYSLHISKECIYKRYKCSTVPDALYTSLSYYEYEYDGGYLTKE